MKSTVKPTSLRLENSLLKELDVLSKEVHRPKSWIIKQAIRYYIDERADLQIALERLQDPNTEYLNWEDVKDDV